MTTIYHQRYRKLIDHYKNTVCEGYTERHHIIPKCMGGSDRKDNIVALPAKAHYLAHLLLARMYPDNTRLKRALGAMSRMQNRRQLVARQYAKAKEAASIAHSKETIIDGNKFCSRLDAAKYYNVSIECIYKWLKNGGKSNVFYIDSVPFRSQQEAADYFGVSYSSISSWKLTGKSSERWRNKNG